ncbi:MAG: hypothetical protein ACP5Q5_07935 [Brevinematia bacterium]
MEFIEKNNGKFQIISYNAFFEKSVNSEIERNFQGIFPGTIVNLQFRTDVQSTYMLPNEMPIEELF